MRIKRLFLTCQKKSGILSQKALLIISGLSGLGHSKEMMDFSISIPRRASKQWSVIQQIPEVFRQINGETVKIFEVMEEFRRLPDVLRYELEWDGVSFAIRRIFSAGKGAFHDQLVEQRCHPAFVVVIESPHKMEYNADFLPIAPAQGGTGKKLEQYLTVLLNRTFQSGFDRGRYDLIISNPVPFQASLFHLHHLPLIRPEVAAVRDRVWKVIFARERQDFLNRLTSYAPALILNAVTSRLKPLLTETLLSWRDMSPERASIPLVVASHHPCVWSDKSYLTRL